ncbi:tyrosine-protein phosphatase non-receptor type 4-like [Clavelina lepadiformis]|uniref:protein-tyrosine-phosphatase n=1 Tax=Clavelina lepadiformis TaxID=159417 RepID=A0ABP0GZD7_CLALP
MAAKTESMMTQNFCDPWMGYKELPQDKKQSSSVKISVVFLDHSEVVFIVNKRDRGQVLLNTVFHHLRVTEARFFGLQFPCDIPDTMRWLDPAKSIRKQFKRGYPYTLHFRVKFYPTETSAMKDEFTRYQLFLQIKLDLLERRLSCSMSATALIASLAVQTEIGDYNVAEHERHYIKQFKFIPNQSKEFEAEVERLHKLQRGLMPSQAEYLFIRKAQKLDMYGVELHHAKDDEDQDLDVGVASDGILLFQNEIQIKHLRWSSIVKISFKRKLFCIQLRPTPCQQHNSEHLHSFHMDNYRACKRLWKSCVDFHSFYRQDRCLNSSCSHPSLSNKIVGTKSDKALLGFFALNAKQRNYDKTYSSSVSQSDLRQYSYCAHTNYFSVNENHDYYAGYGDKKNPRRLSAPPSVSFGVLDGEFCKATPKKGCFLNSNVSDNKEVTNSSLSANSGYSSEESPCVVELLQNETLPSETKDMLVMTNTVDDCRDETSYFTNCSSISSSSMMNSDNLHQNVVSIKLNPDSNGRYGFNVKGGADYNNGITISKVVEDSPAALCSPRLNIGDHVLQVNGKDLRQFSHDQVIRFIKKTCEDQTEELELLVLPNCIRIENTEKPLFSELTTADRQVETNVLDNSIKLLENMLSSGEVLSMFDKLHRKKPGETTNHARLPLNSTKNRYRDVLPYDSSRVSLSGSSSNYINANYVNIKIPGTDWTNHYIASQGPLPNTCADFWTMIWEQKANFIVMLTVLLERGRTKCHQYWPENGELAQFGQWNVQSLNEKVSSSFAFRDFRLYHCHESASNSASRLIHQMQYIAWPDHGVPDDSSDFLDFILQVRQKRVGMKEPCVVHCSAGIGRTGVLITVETAMCLIEANQPIYPIDIAETLRNHRAMMIQTTSQFKFICDAIIRVYKEGLAKPILDNECTNVTDSDNSLVKG